MALATDYIYVIYDITTGTATSRTVLRWYSGTYDSTGVETDARPIDGSDYDSLTEGWIAVDGFPITEVTTADPTSTLKNITYTVNTTTGVVTATEVDASISERQKHVLKMLSDRRQRLQWTQMLGSKADNTSFANARSVISNIDNVDTVYSTLWSTNPEAILSDSGVAEPTVTETTTSLAERMGQLISDLSVARGKLSSRASYDFSQSIGLGPFNNTTTETQVAYVDLGAIPKGNIWVISYSFEARNTNNTSGQTTVYCQSRAAEPGGALSAWQTDASFGGGNFGLVYSSREYTYVFGGNWDDAEFRLTYVCQNSGSTGIVKNVYITAVKLTVWE